MREQRGDLSGPNCHAVVVGTGRHGAGGSARLADLPSAARSARAVAKALREKCDMDGRVTEIIDPVEPTEVLAAVQSAIDASEGGVVLFCFVGHGLLGPQEELYLATSQTTSADDTVYAVPYGEVRKRLSAAPARPVVILDCCFSGLADAAQRDAYRDPFASARPDGSFLLASATHYAASFAPADEELTLFSGELLRLLADGDTGGPQRFTLFDIYRILDQRFQGGPARPHSAGMGRAGDLVFARNAGYAATAEGPAPDVGGDGPCPYPGMRPFLPEQRHLFFGREELTRRLLNRVTGEREEEPVVLVGPSGAGKSSLLRAGLVAGLEEERAGRVLLVPGPGALPFRTLAEHWARAVGRPFAEVERELGAGRFGEGGPGVLVVDQLEEIFTQCQDTEERELFIRAVSGRDAAGPRIVLGLRADFYGQCQGDARLARIVRSGQFDVSAMSDDELRSAVELPAEYAGLRLEDGLADHLLRELRQERAVEGDAVALPFLAHALRQTWARRRGTLLTFAGYQAGGGIRTSVTRVADEVHDALDDTDQRRLRELLLRMVSLVDDEGRAVRRRVQVQNLGGAAELLDRLVAARLVVVDRGEAQLCHDSLLYGWRRLRDWINEDRVGLLLRRRLGEAADGWDEAGRRASGLYSGDQLASARALLAQDGRVPATRLVEREFLHASSRRERLTKRVLVVGVSLMVTLAVVASTLAVLARGSQRDAEAREATLIADQLAAQADSMREEDPQTALRLSLAAYRTADTPQTRSSLYGAYVSRTPAVLQGSRKAVLNVAFSSDGDVLATSQTKGGVQLWDVSRANTPDKAKHIEPGGISAAIAFHPRSRLLAAQTEQALTLWDVADPAKPRRLAERGLPEGQTYSLAFSPDGRVLAAGGEGGRLRLWDVSEPSAPRLRTDRVVARTALISLTFSREGQSLVTGNGISKGRSAEVRLWDVRNPARPVVRDTATARTVMAVAFHPKRDLVVATGAEGEIAWWTVEQGALVPVEAQDEFGNRWGDTGIPSLSFRPDGELLAGARGDAGAGLRTAAESGSELTDGSAEKGTLAGGEPVQSVAYSPDGTHLAVGEVGGAVLLWPEHAPAPAVTGELSPEDRGAGPVSPDGRFVVTTSLLDSGTVWDLRPVDTTKGTGPRQRQRLISPWEPRFFLPGRDRPVLLAQRWPGPAQNHVFRLWDVGGDGPPTHGADIPFVSENTRVAVSGDGRLLVIGSWKSPRTEVWDIRDVRRPVRRAVIDVPPSAEPGTLWFLDSRALATVQNAQRGDLMIWDLTDPGRPRQVELLKGVARGRGGYVRSAKLLITDYTAERAQLWDMTGFPRKPRKAGTLPAASGGYHPVGKGELATMLKDGTVQFWDVSDPYKPSSKPKRSIRFDREIKSVELAPDGKQVVTKDPYRVWDIGQDGRWLTPAVATLEGVKQLTLLSANSPFMAVQPDYSRNSGPATTYLLDRDTDKIYDRLCRTHPLSVGTEQWDALFPHLGHRPSCG